MKGKIKDSKGQVVYWQYTDNIIKINLHPLRITEIKDYPGLTTPEQVIKALDSHIGATEVIE